MGYQARTMAQRVLALLAVLAVAVTAQSADGKKCKNNCNGHGECVQGQCFCQPLWAGDDCSFKQCPMDCNGRGECVDGVCQCDEGMSGDDCSIGVPKCPGTPECSLHGVCQNGTCKCDQGWMNRDCSKSICINGCNGRGACQTDGKCKCMDGWTGVDCGFRKGNGCPSQCNAHGKCIHDKYGGYVCECELGWS